MQDLTENSGTITPLQVVKARKLLNWSRNRLAGACGLTHSTIARFEETGRIAKAISLSDSSDRAATIRMVLEEAGVSFEAGQAYLLQAAALPEPRLRRYTIVLVDPSGWHMAEPESFEAESDAIATQRAARLLTPKTGVEVWQSYKKIAVLPPECATTTDD